MHDVIGKWRLIEMEQWDQEFIDPQLENLAPATKALEDLYRILCRGCEIYLFPSTDTFRAIGVPQPEFLEHLLLLKAQVCPPNEWISQVLSLMQRGAYGDTTTTQLQDVLVRTLKTSELKELAIGVISSQVDHPPNAATGSVREESSTRLNSRRDLLRLGFQIAWALGEKERALRWLQIRAGREDNAGHLVLQFLLETKDREIWVREYESIRRDQPSIAETWSKTFERAQQQAELPGWRV